MYPGQQRDSPYPLGYPLGPQASPRPNSQPEQPPMQQRGELNQSLPGQNAVPSPRQSQQYASATEP
eukprot:scaffold173559_cov15-Prasinocladus_malaysianus.AAC.1